MPRLRNMKLAVVTSIPTPYRDPFWNEVAAHPDIDLFDVYYCAENKPDRPWEVNWKREFNSHLLPSFNLLKLAGADRSAYWVKGLQSALKHARHDAVIIGGYNHPSMLQTIHGCIKRRQPYFLMCETYKRRKTWKSLVKNRLMTYICRHAAGAMPTGKLACAYLRSYGILDEQMILVPNVPDVCRLQSLAESLGQRGCEIRNQLGLPQVSPVITFVGRMIPQKRPELVIRAFTACAAENTWLVMLGDGPLMPTCRRLVEDLGVADRVLLPGFCQPKNVPLYLSVSRAFVLPSSETWGVAAFEAVAMGVPVILSNQVGCHPDLVRNINTGTVVPIDSVNALAEAATYYLNRSPAEILPQPRDEHKEFFYSKISNRLVDRIQKLIQTDEQRTGKTYQRVR